MPRKHVTQDLKSKCSGYLKLQHIFAQMEPLKTDIMPHKLSSNPSAVLPRPKTFAFGYEKPLNLELLQQNVNKKNLEVIIEKKKQASVITTSVKNKGTVL